MSEKQYLQNNEQPPPYAESTGYTVGAASAIPGSVPPQKYSYTAPTPGFVPPPQGYPTQATPQAVPAQRIVITGVQYGPFPIRAPCQQCQQEVTTTITPVTGGITWLLSGILCLSGLFCGCCLVPFCLDVCQDIEHHCPQCRSFMGIYKRMG